MAYAKDEGIKAMYSWLVGFARRDFGFGFQKRIYEVTVVLGVTVPKTNDFEFWLRLKELNKTGGGPVDIECRKREGAAPSVSAKGFSRVDIGNFGDGTLTQGHP